PFTHDFSAYIPQPIDFELMNEACKPLFNHRDFQCFSKVKTDVWTYNCDIMAANWEKQDTQLVFTIKADRFLRNMVRAIVGTLLEIGQRKRKLSDMEKVLESKSRGRAGKSVAAKGLFLHKIYYPSHIKYN